MGCVFFDRVTNVFHFATVAWDCVFSVGRQRCLLLQLEGFFCNGQRFFATAMVKVFAATVGVFCDGR